MKAFLSSRKLEHNTRSTYNLHEYVLVAPPFWFGGALPFGVVAPYLLVWWRSPFWCGGAPLFGVVALSLFGVVALSLLVWWRSPFWCGGAPLLVWWRHPIGVVAPLPFGLVALPKN